MKNDLSRANARSALDQLQMAAILLTRLPLPTMRRAAFENAARAAWAYPVVGAMLGAIAVTLASIGLWLGLDETMAAGLLLAVLMLLTGAMHEDGLADCADGFWGGTDRVRRLEIMRDSRIGTYGVLALIMVTILRWSAITALVWLDIWAVVAACALSRGAMPLVMAHLDPARDDGLSRSVGAVSRPLGWIAFLIGTAIALVFVGWVALWAVLPLLLVTWAVARLAKAKIAGQTGDVLGAVQQLGEVTVLLVLTATLTT